MPRSTSPLRHSHARLAALLLAVAASHSTARLSAAQNYVVTNTNDAGAGSLRDAITRANAFSSTAIRTIQIQPTGTITLQSPLPLISFAGSITGNPASGGTVINGNNLHRPFFIDLQPQATPLTLTIANFTLSNGRAKGGNGGDGFRGGGGGLGAGGAIFVNSGAVTLSNVVTSNSSAIGGKGGAGVGGSVWGGGGGGLGGNGGGGAEGPGGGGGLFGNGGPGRNSGGVIGGGGGGGKYFDGGEGRTSRGGGGCGSLSQGQSPAPNLNSGGRGGSGGGGNGGDNGSGSAAAGQPGTEGGGGGGGGEDFSGAAADSGGAGGRFGGGGGMGNFSSTAGNGGQFGGGGGGVVFGSRTPGNGGFGAGAGGGQSSSSGGFGGGGGGFVSGPFQPGAFAGNGGQASQSANSGGGGGAAIGGAIFVRPANGASLTLADCYIDSGSVTAGAGGSVPAGNFHVPGSPGQTAGSSLFLPGGTTTVFVPLTSALPTNAIASTIADYAIGGNAGTLNKTGPGNLYLSGANTYAGGTTISAGTLSLGVGANGSVVGPISVASGAILALSRQDNYTFTNPVSGGGGLAHTGSGTVTISTFNTYSGGTAVSAGTLKLAGVPLPAGNVSIASGAVLQFDAPVPTTFVSGGTITGGGTLRKTGASTLAFGSGPVQVNLSPGALVDVQAGTINGSFAYNGDWSGNRSSLNLASGATFDAVEGGPSYAASFDALTGTGTLRGGFSANPGGGVTTITLGAANGSSTFGGTIADSGSGKLALVKAGTGTLILTSSDHTHTGGTTISEGTLQLGNGGTTGALPGPIAISGTLIINRSDNFSFTNPLSGAGEFQKSAANTLTLPAANAFTGRTTVSGGILRLSSTTSLNPAGTVRILSGTLDLAGFNTTVASANGGPNSSLLLGSATFTTGNASNTTLPSNISGTGGSFVKQGSGILVLSGSNSYTGGTTVKAGTLSLAAPAALPAGGDVSLAAGALDIAGNSVTIGNLNFDFGATTRTLTNSGDPAATVTLNGGINFNRGTGDTLIQTRLFLPAGQHVIADPDIFGFEAIYAPIFSAPISGPGGLTKTGSFLSSAIAAPATYTGPTIITGGTLAVATVDALPITTAVTLGSSTLSLSPSTATGVTGGSYNQTIGSLASSASDGFVNLGVATLTVGDATSTTFAGRMYGTGMLVKQGAGTLSLSGANFHTGGVIVNAGMLQLSGSGKFAADGAPLAVNTGGTLNLGGRIVNAGQVNSPGTGVGTLTNGTLNLSGNNLFFRSGTLDANLSGTGNSRIWLGGDAAGTLLLGGINTVAFADNNSTIIGHPLTGTAGIVRLTSPTALGPATIGANTIEAQLFTGTIDANGQPAITVGSLRLQSGAASKLTNSNTSATASFTGTVTLVASATDIGGPGTLRFDGPVVGNGGLNKTGPGTLIFAAANTYSSGTTISGGTLRIGNAGTTGSIVGNITNNAALAFNRSDNLTYSGNISGSGTLTHASTGNLTLTGALTYTGNTSVTGPGKLILNSALNTTTGDILLSSNSSLDFARPRSSSPTLVSTLDNLTIPSASTAKITPSPRTNGTQQAVLILNSLTLTGTGFLDVTNNDLILRNQSLASVRSLVANWLTSNNGLPGTSGLGSSAAFYTPEGAFTTLAVYDNSIPGQTLPTFNGIAVTPTNVLVKYTYLGDTNLDGTVDASDLARLLQGMNGQGSGWNFGDVNYDGVVNFIDLGRTMAALRGQGAPLGGDGLGGGGVIPEPAALGVIVFAGAALVGRKRRTDRANRR